MTRLKFLLVDQDRTRATAIASSLAGFRGVSVTEIDEQLAEGPAEALGGRCVVLAADGAGSIQRIVERITETGIRAKVIAYAEEPSQHEIVKAIAAGAADYLRWPCDPAEIIAAADAATAELSS